MTETTCVIVINFNAGDALQRCVASVLSSKESLRLIVADNASTDGSCERLRSLYGSNRRLEILENNTNLGFGQAVNGCAAQASEPLLLILNPDCELYPNALWQLRMALEQDVGAALAAPCMVDRNEQRQRGSLRSFPDPLKAFMTASGLWRLGHLIPALRGVEKNASEVPQETARTEAVTGACMLVRNEDFQALGGFDESFAMHFEDLDLMYRLHQIGRHILYVPAARVFHQSGTSSRSRPGWVHWQKHLGMHRFFAKHKYASCNLLTRSLTELAIWSHYLIGLPLLLIRK